MSIDWLLNLLYLSPATGPLSVPYGLKSEGEDNSSSLADYTDFKYWGMTGSKHGVMRIRISRIDLITFKSKCYCNYNNSNTYQTI